MAPGPPAPGPARQPSPPGEPVAPPIASEPEPRQPMLVVKLADGKARRIQSMMATSFWSADGKPMSAAQFLESLFGALPEFFQDEDQLRALWSDPATRKKLLQGLADKGFGAEPLFEMQKLIEAQNSDLFDVLAYVAFASTPQTREERARKAMAQARPGLGDRQQEFVNFVLGQYVQQGVDELAEDKLAPLLKLRYGAINDAVAYLGDVNQIRQTFVGVQPHLYAP